MIFIKTIPIDDAKEAIEMIHYHPEELTDEAIASGHVIEDFEEPPIPAGMQMRYFFNPVSCTVFFEFYPRPKTEREKLDGALLQIEDLQIAMAQLMGV